MLRETISNVPVDLAESLAGMPKVKVVLPALQVPVQFLNQLRDRLAALAMVRHLVQLLPFLLQGFRRRTHIQIPPPAPVQVLVVAERESQKVQSRSFFLQMHHPGLFPIDLQPQPTFEFRFNPARQTSPLVARQHHEIVGIAHQLGPRPLNWSIGPMKQLVEPMQVYITEQRRNHPALGSPLAWPTPLLRLALLARLYDWGLQPHPDQLEDAPGHHSHAHTSQKLVAAYLLQRLVGRPARTKPIGTVLEICFEDRLQDQQGRHLDHSVAHRRDAQRPHFPIRLWSVDAPYRFRRVGLGAQRLLDFVQEPLHTGFRRFNLFDRYAIHPGRALIGTYPFPTRFQHIAPIDPVVQHIKPELRFLLGLLAQLLSQQREFVWGSVSAHLFLQGFDMLPFFRSGNLFQAVLLSSYSSNASSEAPWLHGRYPASSLLWASPTPGQGRSLGYVFPRAVGGRLPFPALPGLPGSSTDLSLRACPQPPRKVRRVLAHCSPAGVRLHPHRADWPPPAA